MGLYGVPLLFCNVFGVPAFCRCRCRCHMKKFLRMGIGAYFQEHDPPPELCSLGLVKFPNYFYF